MATILVVDDRPFNREFLAMLLGYVGHAVIEASEGKEALAAVAERYPDLVITDLLMPGMDGIEFTRALRANPDTAPIPVIFYTATYRSREAEALAASCGASAVIAKPAEPQLILDTVASILGAHPEPQRARGGRRGLPQPGVLATRPGAHLGELQLSLKQSVSQGLDLLNQNGEVAPTPLAGVFGTVQSLSLRMSAVIELGLELPAFRNPQRLLEMFCRAAQDIMNARLAVVGILDRQGSVAAVAAAGNGDGDGAWQQDIDPGRGLIARALAEGQACTAHGLGGDAQAAAGLPPSHPPVESLLVAPLTSAGRSFGWFYVADKVGGGGFAADDQQFAATLASQLAVAYDNLALYQEVGDHAARLETEIVERKRAAEALRESEERGRQLLETSNDAVVLVDEDNRIEYANSAVRGMFGFDPGELVGQGLVVLQPERLRNAHLAAFTRYRETGRRNYNWNGVELTARHKDGHEFPVEISMSDMVLDGRRRFAGFIRDLTLRHQQQDRIARLNRIYVVLSGINSAIVRIRERQALFDEACRIAVEAGGFATAWIGMADPGSGLLIPAAGAGVAADAFTGLRISSCPAPAVGDHSAGDALARRRILFCNEVAAMAECDCTLRHFVQKHGLGSFVVLPLVTDTSAGVMAFFAREPGFFDADELKLLEELAGDISFALQYIENAERLQTLAYYDSLTGLPNATLFTDRFTQLLHVARHEGEKSAVVVMDLDRFKQVNDSFGRHVGDQLLKQVGRRLEQCVRGADTLARVGSDRFVVGISGLAQGEDVAAVLRDRILAALRAPFVEADRQIELGAKAGIAVFPDDGDDAEVLFRNAEVALKQAKANGEPYLYYAPEINARIVARQSLEGQLRAAVANREFELHYQPRGDLRSGEMAGVEALIRWRRPDGQLVPPGEFIPLAEETGLIVPIGAWVIDAACARQAQWLAAGLDVLPVAVNLSAVQLTNNHLLDTLRRSLDTHNLHPKHLELELTESAVMRDPERAAGILAALKQAGLKLSLDDFGTGYSSLAYLKRFPFDAVKIDRTFVTDITTDPDDAAIATAVIAMAHRLNLRVIAEGVETEGQLSYVRAHGCHEIQGYYFSRPLPAEEFEILLRERKRLPLPADADDLPGTVLVVDDEPNMLTALSRLFRRDGYRVLTAGSGPEGLDLLAVNPVQVIISDQRMPGMNGSEFLSIVKELYPDTIRIILSGYTDLEVVLDAVNRGAVYKFLTKPWENELLREHVRDAFRRYRPQLRE